MVGVPQPTHLDADLETANPPGRRARAERGFVSRLSHLMRDAAALDPTWVAVASSEPELTRTGAAMELAGALPDFVLWLHSYLGALEELLKQPGGTAGVVKPEACVVNDTSVDFLDVASADSFPASDAPAWATGQRRHPAVDE